MFTLRSGVPAAALIVASFVALLFLFLRTWFIATGRTRNKLISREDLGDHTRMLILAGSFVAIGLTGLAFAGLLVADIAAAH